MNYITVIYGICFVYSISDWFLRARYSFLKRGNLAVAEK